MEDPALKITKQKLLDLIADDHLPSTPPLLKLFEDLQASSDPYDHILLQALKVRNYLFFSRWRTYQISFDFQIAWILKKI